MLLVMLPVAGMAGGAIFWQSHVPTPEQRAALELGRHLTWIQVAGGADPSRWQSVDQPWENGVDVDDAGKPTHTEGERPISPSGLIPESSTVSRITEWGAVDVETAAGIATVAATIGEPWSAPFDGRYVVVEGERPREATEAMVSPGLLQRMGAEIGDDVRLVDSDRSFTVTGTMRRAGARPSDLEAFLPPGETTAQGGVPRWFVEDWQPSLDELQDLNHAGFIAYARDLVMDPPAGARTSAYPPGGNEAQSMLIVGLMVAVFSGYLVVLLAGAAFAVAARRQQQSLAVAASVGAARRDVFRAVVLQGTVLGALGGGIGVLIGAGGAWVVLRLTDSGAVGSFFGNWGFNVPWPAVAGILVFAVVVGTLAALAPARSATRGDVIGALRGARRPARLRARRPLWGLGLMILGVAATAAGGLTVAALNASEPVDHAHPLRAVATPALLLGPVVFQIGFLLAGHWLLVALARPLSRVGISARLGARDAAANPSRVVPAFAAVAACVFIASYVLSTTALTTGASARTYGYTGPLHSVTVMTYQNGSAHSAQVRDAAEDLVRSTSPRATGWIHVPAAAEYDMETGTPTDPDTPVFAAATQPTEECPSCDDRMSALNGQVAVVDPADLAVVLDHEFDSAVLDEFQDGSALVTADEFISWENEVVLTEWTESLRNDFYDAMNVVDWDSDDAGANLPEPLEEHRLPAIRAGIGSFSNAQVVISPRTAERLGIATAPALLVATYDEIPTAAMIDRLTEAADSIRPADAAGMSIWYEDGPDPVAPWLWLILGVAAVLVVGAGAVCLGLARFERRTDDATLSAIGGSRLLRRNVNAWQAILIIGIGSVVGTAAGFIPVWGTVQSSSGYLDLVDTPWLWLAMLAAALPLAIAAVAWLVPPRHPDLTRRTAIA